MRGIRYSNPLLFCYSLFFYRDHGGVTVAILGIIVYISNLVYARQMDICAFNSGNARPSARWLYVPNLPCVDSQFGQSYHLHDRMPNADFHRTGVPDVITSRRFNCMCEYLLIAMLSFIFMADGMRWAFIFNLLSTQPFPFRLLNAPIDNLVFAYSSRFCHCRARILITQICLFSIFVPTHWCLQFVCHDRINLSVIIFASLTHDVYVHSWLKRPC